MFDTLTRMGSSAAGAYEIERSLRFDVHGGNADGAHLQRTFGSAGNRKTWTFSFWAKKTGTGGEQVVFNGGGGGNGNTTIRWDTDDSFHVFEYNSGFTYRLHTKRLFRDPLAWYHIVVTLDTTQGTADNRIKIYVNGVQETSFENRTNPAQDTDYTLNNNIEHTIGNNAVENHNANYFNGYLTEINFVDGTALAASSFGKTDAETGQWIPKKYGGSHGTNGFYLNFSDNSDTTSSTLGDDDSANTNDWTPNNLSVSAGEGNDSLLDTPTNNYCTLNPICGGSTTFTQGALNTSMAAVNGCGVSSFAFDSGKWYAEYVITSIAGYAVMGIAAPHSKGWNVSQEANAQCVVWAHSTGTIYDLGDWTHASGTLSGHTFTTNDVIGLALNMDDKELTVYKNNTNTGTIAFTHSDDSVCFMMGMSHGSSAGAGYANFGQRPFNTSSTEPPTGYQAPCTANLPEPTIKKSTDHFNTILYTGNGNASQSKTVGFQPDLVWIKSRSFVEEHMLYDSVRGTGKDLRANSTATEGDNAQGLNAFNSDGFTIGTMGNVNQNNETYVAYCWKVPTSFSNDASATSVGTIDSTGKNNATAGFGFHTFVSAEGGTIAHGLGVKPDIQIQKNRDDTVGWGVQTDVIDGSWDYMFLNEDDDKGDTSEYLTSTTAKNGQGASQNGDDIISYLFSSVAGFSKVSNYEGNGNTNGTFVYTGFKPAFVLLKRAVGGDASWVLHDNKRAGYNGDNDYLHPDLTQAESDGSSGTLDLLSNGFKLRMTSGTHNGTGDTYLYIAFAERPFKYANAR